MKTLAKFSIGAAAIALLAGGIAIAQPGDRPNPDANGDGNVTRTEATAHATAMFARRDANGDGRLTPEDRTAAQARRHAERFAAIDSDNNGNITRTEWDAHHTAMMAARANDDDDDDDGRGPGRRGHHGRHGDEHGRGGDDMGGEDRGRMARLADTNNDNAIDRTEFVAAAAARFQRADANNDGTVTAAERAAHRAQMRDRADRRGNVAPAAAPAAPANSDDTN